MNMEGGKAMLDQFLCCLTQKEDGHALTFHYSSIEGALNSDIHWPKTVSILNLSIFQ